MGSVTIEAGRRRRAEGDYVVAGVAINTRTIEEHMPLASYSKME
jgi:hypothetical protein